MLSRRDLVRIAGLSAAGAALGGCDPSSFQRALPRSDEMSAATEQARKLASRETLVQTLERIRAWSERNNPVVARALRPGLTAAEIDSKTKDLPFRLPREAYWLYGWRNGTGRSPGCFFLYHQWPSLEDAVAEYQGLMDLGLGWNRMWFPLFWFQDEHFFHACGESSEEALPVLKHFLEDTEIPVSFTNLTTLALTEAEALETGASWVSDKEQGYLGTHDGSFSKIHQRHNPGASYPYYIDPQETPPPARTG
jgi:hypothetical protein